MLWNLSAAIRGYLRFYMPTNRLLDWLRTPHGAKWAIPATLIGVPIYLYGVSAVALLATDPGLGGSTRWFFCSRGTRRS